MLIGFAARVVVGAVQEGVRRQVRVGEDEPPNG
jgi:hypothetical protein